MRRNALAAAVVSLFMLLAPAIGGASSERHASTAKNPASVLNGVYRVSHTEKELLAAGWTGPYLHENTGVITLWLKDGRYRFHTAGQPECRGGYTIAGHTIYIDQNVLNCHGILYAKWALKDGYLRFHLLRVEPGDHALWESKPWKKIG